MIEANLITMLTLSYIIPGTKKGINFITCLSKVDTSEKNQNYVGYERALSKTKLNCCLLNCALRQMIVLTYLIYVRKPANQKLLCIVFLFSMISGLVTKSGAFCRNSVIFNIPCVTVIDGRTFANIDYII